jgi:hypothetical protein
MTNGKKSAQATKKRKLALVTPRALLRKHARIKKNGRVELEKGWSDRKLPRRRRQKSSWCAGCAGTCTPAFASRSCASPYSGIKRSNSGVPPARAVGTFFIPRLT